MTGEESVKSWLGDRRASRREFLCAASAAGLGLLSAPGSGFGQSSRPSASQPVVPRLDVAPWWLERFRPRSRVVDVRSDRVLHATVTDPAVLGEMIDQGMRDLTGAPTAEQAWRLVLGSAERIVLKFNSVGAGAINTNDVVAQQLVERLAAAGYDPASIAAAEVPELMCKQLGTRSLPRGWGGPVGVGSGLEPLAQYLHDADAVVNVPQLKTHQVAGMSGCMKNLSHALIRHPARYHADGCSPYVAQVVGSQEVSSRLKLNIVNAVRLVVDRGPDAREQDLVGYGGLLFGFDPLAIDTVGLSILATERQRLGLPTALEVRYLGSAAEMGLGRWRPADIDRVGAHVGE